MSKFGISIISQIAEIINARFECHLASSSATAEHLLECKYMLYYCNDFFLVFVRLQKDKNTTFLRLNKS